MSAAWTRKKSQTLDAREVRRAQKDDDETFTWNRRAGVGREGYR